ncbi:hypothetical protein FEM48_Zijuj07G0160700 [Ziziphus jujuba var. spinosa]|uniref:Leucine-rich repeat-containing N-terminal plant-type domain-containing protein n=1 Tax=Ziziphus jujuba var. spinosa TaxID=714518 RepID=A0A978V5L2_ZIZJJ|nr:hypothetical protein FEM48_Zijuj07G0160700 [Ziziphus jujuba var. spinosa]
MIMHNFLTCQYALSSSTPSWTTNRTNTDMLALLAFKSQIELPSNSSILSSWNTNTNFCNWVGVSCSLRHQRVTGLNLQFKKLKGTISPHIGNLSFIRHLNLYNNCFYGPLPETIGQLHRLRLIDLR